MCSASLHSKTVLQHYCNIHDSAISQRHRRPLVDCLMSSVGTADHCKIEPSEVTHKFDMSLTTAVSYHAFCKANRPTLPTNLKSADREKLLGEMWKSVDPPGVCVEGPPPAAKIEFTSPYHAFCKATRPKLPTNMKNAEREKLLGLSWKSLSKDRKAEYRSGLARPLRTGQGGNRAWVSTQGEELQPQAAREIPRHTQEPAAWGSHGREHIFSICGGGLGSTYSIGAERLTQADRWARAKKECPWSLSNLQPAPDPEVLEPPAKRRATAGGVMDVNSKAINPPLS